MSRQAETPSGAGQPGSDAHGSSAAETSLDLLMRRQHIDVRMIEDDPGAQAANPASAAIVTTYFMAQT